GTTGNSGTSEVCSNTASIPLTISSIRENLSRSDVPDGSFCGPGSAGCHHQDFFDLGEIDIEFHLHILEHPTVLCPHAFDGPDHLVFRENAILSRCDNGIANNDIIEPLYVLERAAPLSRSGYDPMGTRMRHDRVDRTIHI